MTVLKASGKIFGAHLTRAEQKALDIELKKRAAEFEKLHAKEIESMILYTLMVGYGWKKKRLHQFWDQFRAIHSDLIRRYEISTAEWDDAWICTKKLAEQGIDVSEWDQELDV